jgi:hypothetical protein
MSKYNIEFGHVYANEMWNFEQELSYSILKQLFDALKKNYSLVILVDNYNSDIDNFTIPQEKEGIKIFYEKDMANQGPHFLSKLDNKYIEWLNSKDKLSLLFKPNKEDCFTLEETKFNKSRYTCNFLTAIWYINRYLNYPDSKLITIISKKYQKNEEKSLRLLQYLGYENLAKEIKLIYY